MRFKKIYMLSISLLLIGSLSGCASNEEKVMKYLEKTYNQEFVLESFRNSGILESSFHGGKGIASLKNDNSLVFNVGVSESKENVLYDNYDLVKLSKELTEDVKYVVIDDYGDKSDCKILLRSSETVGNEIISAEDFLEKSKDNTETIAYVVIEVDSIDDIRNSYQTILSTYDKLKSYGTEDYAVIVGYVGDINKPEIREFFRLIGIVDYSWNKINGDIYGRLIINENSEINTLSDMDKYFESYE